MLIRATARTSALCIAFAFARIRTREFLIALPVSHALHFAAILTLAAITTPANAHIGVNTIGGIAIFGLMIFAAMHRTTWPVYALWIISVIGFAIRNMRVPVYPLIMAVLLASAIVRVVRRHHAA